MKTKTAAEQRIRGLYHYDPYRDPSRLERILAEKAIYFSNPNDFNDPWDCKPFYSKSVLNDPTGYARTVEWFVKTSRKIDRSISDEEHKRREKILLVDRPRLEWMIDQLTEGMIQAVIAQYRVYCLSERADLPLMWSHYGNSHRGYCLEYSVNNALFCGALPVQYVDVYPELDLTDNTEDEALRALLTKSRDWEYESEYRVIATAPGYTFTDMPATRANFVALPTGSLKSIIFGCLMPKGARDDIAAMVRNAGSPVMLKAAHRASNRYALEIEGF